MLTRIAVVLTVSLLAASPARATGIPVFDAQAAAHYIKVLLYWKDQNEAMRYRIEQARDELEALTGTRNLGEILRNPMVRRYLPYEWQVMLRDVERLGRGGLIGTARSVRDESFVYDTCVLFSSPESRHACEADAARPAIRVATWADIDELLDARTEQIEQLQSAINETEDPMAIGQLGVRVETEVAAIVSEGTRAQVAAYRLDAEERLAEQQASERRAEMWAAPPTFPQIAPISFKTRAE